MSWVTGREQGLESRGDSSWIEEDTGELRTQTRSDMRAEGSCGHLGIFHKVGDLQVKLSLRHGRGKSREKLRGRVQESTWPVDGPICECTLRGITIERDQVWMTIRGIRKTLLRVDSRCSAEEPRHSGQARCSVLLGLKAKAS